MILITGGTGFIGRKLVAALAETGRAVRVLTRTPAAAAELPHAVGIREGNLLDPRSLHETLEGVTTVVHLGAAVEGSDSTTGAFRVNVDGTRNLALAARSHGVTTLIHCSSAGVYGNGTTEIPHAETAIPAPQSKYERSKFESERALVDALDGSIVRWIILRPTGVHGPGRPATVAMYRMIQRRKLWIHGPARVIVHPTYVDDVVQGVRLVLDRVEMRGEIFNIGGERAIPYPELIVIVADALKSHVVQITPFPSIIRGGAVLLDAAMNGIGLEPSHVVRRLAQPIVNRAVDISKARRELGFKPVSLEAGIRETVNWFNGLQSIEEGLHTDAR
jgi:nucleoside-diphosphate-sugar epimerase